MLFQLRAARSVPACTAALLWLVIGAPHADAQSTSDFVPVTDAMLQDPAPADWLMWRRTLDGWGYSPLERIDRTNVGDLRMVWSRGMSPGSQQATRWPTAACCTCRTRET